jgi:NitT/TauT family transport system permease protein
MGRSIKRVWNLVGPFLIMALIWEAIGQLADPQLLPPFSAVCLRIGTAVGEGEALLQVWATLRKMLLSFGIGTFIGITGGLIIGWFRIAEAFFSPLIYYTYSLPRVALIPLFILWLGIGDQTIVTAASIAVVYLVLINTIAGVKATDPLLIRAAQNLGAQPHQILFRVLLPSSLGIIFSGLRLGIGQALVSVVSGEILIGSSGLGYWIWAARYNLDTALVFVILFLLAILGYSITKGAEKGQERLEVWRLGRREELWEE